MPYLLIAAFLGGGYVGFKLSGGSDKLITLLIVGAVLYLLTKGKH
ncbi:hypothetical protein ACVV7M_002577 [Vibrio vulnificus]|nr:hypothetical protein [Vibrio vulnificus]MCU8400101.1 hypothetical protein [Vibrio vulnificus]